MCVSRNGASERQRSLASDMPPPAKSIEQWTDISIERRFNTKHSRPQQEPAALRSKADAHEGMSMGASLLASNVSVVCVRACPCIAAGRRNQHHRSIRHHGCGRRCEYNTLHVSIERAESLPMVQSVDALLHDSRVGRRLAQISIIVRTTTLREARPAMEDGGDRPGKQRPPGSGASTDGAPAAPQSPPQPTAAEQPAAALESGNGDALHSSQDEQEEAGQEHDPSAIASARTLSWAPSPPPASGGGPLNGAAPGPLPRPPPLSIPTPGFSAAAAAPAEEEEEQRMERSRR